MDSFRQDLRVAARSLVRAPGFTAIALITLALGIGANTAIFSIVNGVILRPLAYPKPEQLMYLTTQFPGFGFEQFWVSPPEYLEFREINQSFSAVGAFRPARSTSPRAIARCACARLGGRASVRRARRAAGGQGRLFAKGETEVSGPPPAPGAAGAAAADRACCRTSLWQSRIRRPDRWSVRSSKINGRRREVIGIMPPGTDVMDNRTEIWLPLGLNPANRQNRGNHFLYLVGRLKDGVTPAGGADRA